VAGTRIQAEKIRAIRAGVLCLPDAADENSWKATVETALAALAVRQAGVDPESPAGQVMRRCISFWRPSQQRLFAAAAKRLIPFRDDACLEMYMEFGMSTNRRGRDLVRLLKPHVDPAGKRHLDVGAAYAGFSAAFAEAGARSEALEIDPELIAVARANLEDLNMDFPIHRADVTNQAEIAPLLDRFDIITCNDVVEHVLDAPGMLRNVQGMLRAGGAAYFEIPNGEYAGFVREDGHYLQFGITLLERPEAEVFYECIRPGMPYRMGRYYSLDDYFRMMESAGLRPVLIEGQTTPGDWEQTEAALVRLRSESESRLATVPEALRPRVREEVAKYLSRVEGTPRITPEERTRFVLRYGTAFWRILAYRAGGPSSSKGGT
jgi:SAM-dependent methyltransferase